MTRRINIVLPETAILAMLESTAIRDRDLDLEIAADWDFLEPEPVPDSRQEAVQHPKIPGGAWT